MLLWQIQIDRGPGDTSTVLNFRPIVFHYSFTFHLLFIKFELSADEVLKQDYHSVVKANKCLALFCYSVIDHGGDHDHDDDFIPPSLITGPSKGDGE